MKNINKSAQINQQNNFINLGRPLPLILPLPKKIINLSEIQYDINAEENCKIIYRNFLKKVNYVIQKKGALNKYPSMPSPDKIWKFLSFEEHLTPTHINLKTPEIYNDFKGSFFISSSDWVSPFKRVKFKDMDNVHTIAMGGLDYYTIQMFDNLRKNFYKFSLVNNQIFVNTDSVVFYYPLYNKERRVEELLKFEQIDNYCSSEMRGFAYKYVIPKILAGEQLSFFCYSASCRELLMIENACRDYFQQKDKFQVKELMAQVNATLIGYAFDWSKDNNKCGFNKTIITSAEDFGVLRTKLNRELIYGCSLLSQGITAINRSSHNSDIAYVFGPNTMSIDVEGRINYNGHSLTHYISALNNLNESSIISKL